MNLEILFVDGTIKTFEHSKWSKYDIKENNLLVYFKGDLILAAPFQNVICVEKKSGVVSG